MESYTPSQVNLDLETISGVMATRCLFVEGGSHL